MVKPVNWQHNLIYTILAKNFPIFDVRVKHGLVLGKKMEESWMWVVLVIDGTPACIIYHSSFARAADISGGYSLATEVFQDPVSTSLPLTCLVSCTLHA